MNTRVPRQVVTLALAGTLAACTPQVGKDESPEDAANAAAPPGISFDQLENTTYRGVYDEPVRLTEGRFQGEPFQPGAASRPTLLLLDTPRAYGDLDADGIEEALVVLAESSGGSGTFIYLAAVGNRTGSPENLATRLLGDRVEVETLEVRNGRAHVRLLERMPADLPDDAIVLDLVLHDGLLIEP